MALTPDEYIPVLMRDLKALASARKVYAAIAALPAPVDPLAVVKAIGIPNDSPLAGVTVAVVLTIAAVKDFETLPRPLKPEAVLAALKIPADSPIAELVGAVVYTIEEIKD